MPEYLLIDGGRNGDIVGWPRTDEAPCIFPMKWGTTGPYFVGAVPIFGVFYRVAHYGGHLDVEGRNRLRCKVADLTPEEASRIRIDKEES